ncbi:hypothetical protein TWF481_001586 [Arthrobotrys musiformis]|uniref:DRBM domain-containing protein n=1 Tax=Arthrobotrys musiformis TaxID=47236 RepID=A0AAV9VUR8_9PEZI
MEREMHIKQEVNDYDMVMDPPSYSRLPLHTMGGLPPSLDELFESMGGIQTTQLNLKPMKQYLETDPVSPKNAKPPPRNIALQTFSSVPAAVKPNPKDPTRVVGERATTSYVSDLYEYIQGHCPKHPVESFEFDEPHLQQFTVSLRLKGLEPVTPAPDRKGDDIELTPRLFPSKKAAKEHVAHLALELLKSIPPEPEHIIVGPGKAKGESPMGELNRYCSQNALPRPHVLDTSNSKPPYSFGCEITINIDGERKFGDPNPSCPNKAAARNRAAQAALNWIADKNPKIVKLKGKSGKAGRVLAPGSVVQIDATDKTIGEIATEACTLLGFKAPQKQLMPVEGVVGMYDVLVILEHGDQETKVGPLKNIFGQKTASKEAMRMTFLTAQYLAKEHYGIKVELTGNSNLELCA